MTVGTPGWDAARSEADVRFLAGVIEGVRKGIDDVEFTERTVGGEAALAGSYAQSGRLKAQLSLVRDGIEYRIFVDALSEAQRTGVLTALQTGFSFPDSAMPARARASLPVSRNTFEAAMERVRNQPVGVRAALTAAPSGTVPCHESDK